MEPLVLDGHNRIIDVFDVISDILLSDDFGLLRAELEGIYQEQFRDDYAKAALIDALYAIICERDG